MIVHTAIYVHDVQLVVPASVPSMFVKHTAYLCLGTFTMSVQARL